MLHIALSLALQSSNIALIVEGALEDIGTTKGTIEDSISVKGSRCLTNIRLLKVSNFDCASVVITGIKSHNTQFNFHFIDQTKEGFMYITEKKGIQIGNATAYKITGYAAEKEGGEIIGELQYPKNPSFCIANAPKVKVSCEIVIDDEYGMTSTIEN